MIRSIEANLRRQIENSSHDPFVSLSGKKKSKKRKRKRKKEKQNKKTKKNRKSMGFSYNLSREKKIETLPNKVLGVWWTTFPSLLFVLVSP